MKRKIWNYQMPTVLGLVLLIAGTLATSWVVEKGANIVSLADESNSPEAIRVSNITDNQFTVSYITQKQMISFITVGETSTPTEKILDDRDKTTGTPTERNIHYISVPKLTSGTVYYFTITTGDQEFFDGDKPFTITTGKTLSSNSQTTHMIKGKVLFPEEITPEDTIVYLSSSHSQTISTLIASDGLYTIPVNTIRTKDLSSFDSFNEHDKLQLLLRGSTAASSITYAYQSPFVVPDIIISNDYDFTLTKSPIEKINEDTVLFPSFTSASPLEKNPQIVVPKKEETFTDDKPTFEGVAPPNSTIDILINSTQQIKGKAFTDKNGNWSFRPTTALEPGEHTITVTTKDRFGILKTITNSFTVYAEGSQFIEPSVSPVQPTVTVTPTAIPTPTITVQPTPTIIIAPQVTIIPTPTLQPTVMPTSIPIVQPIPPSGNMTLILLGSIASLLSAVGILLFSFGHGKINV